MQRAYNELVSSPAPDAARTPAPQPPTARARQRQQTQERILSSARRLFAESGYDRTTIRAVAAAAQVNPGLVMHYFGSKEELFRQAADLPPGNADPQTPEQLAEHLLGSLGVKLEDLPTASAAALRSMLTHPEAAEDVREAINQQMRNLSAAMPGDDAVLRATLIGCTVLGVVIGRHLLQLEGLREASPEQITDLLRPCFTLLSDGSA